MARQEDGDQEIDLNGEHDSCVPCSICLDLVSYGGGERSRVKLQCGHEFHLDCIGSAFNMKGMMQCPNCRKIEKGRWLYASGPANSLQELSMEDGAIDNYPLFFSFAEMPYRVHICPFRGLTHLHPSNESGPGIMSTFTPVMTHQHHVSGPHPHGHGWVQFQHAPYQHHQQPSSLPMPINGGTGGFDTSRNLPRFMPPGHVYDSYAGFSVYAENPPLNYLRAWGRDNVPHFP